MTVPNKHVIEFTSLKKKKKKKKKKNKKKKKKKKKNNNNNNYNNYNKRKKKYKPQARSEYPEQEGTRKSAKGRLATTRIGRWASSCQP